MAIEFGKQIFCCTCTYAVTATQLQQQLSDQNEWPGLNQCIYNINCLILKINGRDQIQRVTACFFIAPNPDP
jgi:hypothetical protein